MLISKTKGQSLVETAILLPIILLILFGMLTVGCYIYDRTVFLLAANKGLDTWQGIMYRTDMTEEEKEEKVRESAENSMKIGVFVKNPEVAVINDTDTKTLIVKVKGKYNFLLPIISGIFGSKADMESKSTYIYGE